MFSPCARCFVLCTVFPFLAPAYATLFGYGYLRCLATIHNPPPNEDPVTTGNVQYATHKRVYDPKTKRVAESHSLVYNEEFDHALKVVGTRRGEYVDDPSQKGVAYLVLEREQLNNSFLKKRNFWFPSVLSDFVRFGLAAGVAFTFFPAAKRFSVDVQLAMAHQLPFPEIRHPLTNFFKSVEEYNRAKHRVYISAVGKDAKPWNFKGNI